MSGVLTKEKYASKINVLHHVKPEDTGDSVWRLVQALIDHDAALRAEVERLTKERDEARVTCWNERKTVLHACVSKYYKTTLA